VTILDYDPYAYAIHEDPYPTYAWLRAEAPLYRHPTHGFWALSRHRDVIEAFRDSETFSSAHGVSLDPAASGPHAHRTMSFLAMDPPMHGRMRGLVSRGFTPRRVAELEPRIRELAIEHLDAALEQSDSFDLIGAFAGKLPMDVISELIGVPQADRAELRRLADLLVHREEGVTDVPPSGVDAALRLAGYYAEMIAERRRARTDDLTSALIDAEVDGDRLTDDDIISFLFLMVVAGNETTTKLLANAWYWAWKFGVHQRALSETARIPVWVEETLRYDTSSQMLARVTTREVELYGQTIPAGDRVLLLVGSANRDETVFTDPDRYDLDRPERELQQIASFGFGRHFCLGASLARLEARVALEEAAARIADYDVDEPGATRVHSVNVRGFATLPTTVVRR
jgi:cytochrome P450